MGNEKKSNELKDPFELLLEQIDDEVQPFDLDSKKDDSKNNRLIERNKLSGEAKIYDKLDNLLTKAVLRNLSPGGVGFEIFPVELAPEAHVIVRFINPLKDIGPITCKVQWVADIFGHPHKHKMIGLKFHNLAGSTQTKLNEFLLELANAAGFDPFSR